MKKNIDEVNGVKVIHRYCAATFTTGLFCLLVIASNVLMFFFPFLDSKYLGFGIKGTDLIQHVFFKDSTHMLFYLELFPKSGDLMKWLLFGVGICFIIQLIFSVVLFIFAIELICVGLMKHYKGPLNIMRWMFFFSLLIFASALTISLLVDSYDPAIKIKIFYNYIMLGVSFVSLISVSVIYWKSFKDRYYIQDIDDLKYVNDTPSLGRSVGTPVMIKKVDTIKRVKYTPSIGLPKHLSSIGGHAFSQNQNLVIAVIPYGIKELGNGAFANCLNLKVVSIPKTVKSIGYNCFFNCARLERINYGGTIQEWRHLKRASNWLLKAGTTIVTCADGSIIVNPYH